MTVKVFSTLGFDVLALVRGGLASHFSVKNSRQNKEGMIWRNLGGE
jgi:hypothetical protein